MEQEPTAAEVVERYRQRKAAEAETQALLQIIQTLRQERDEARAAISNARALLEAYGYGAGPEPLPTVMRILTLALQEPE